MNAFGFATFLILFGAFVLFQIRHERMVKDLADRLMAKDYQEYQYYREKYPRDLKHLDDIREQTLDEKPAEKPAEATPKTDLTGFEEDWASEEENELAVSGPSPAVKA